MKMNKTKKPIRFKWFWIFYLILIAALTICAMLFLKYVNQSLVLFESSQPEHFIDNEISRLKSLTPQELLSKMQLPDIPDSPYNDEAYFWQEWAQKLLDSELTSNNGTEVGKEAFYELCSDGVKTATITIQSVNEDVRLKLMSIPTWELVSIVPVEPVLYSYDISYPSNYRLLINGKELSEDVKTGEEPIKGFEYEAEYVEMPVMLNCRIDNLLLQPQIAVYDNTGIEASYKLENYTVTVEPVFYPSDFPEDLQRELNVINIAETWSRFLTKDLSGPRYGLEEARAYFIKDSVFWNMAYDFATGVDITFVSGHRLEGFTNEALTDYIRYNENCFSCIVYFEKNMTLSRSGAPRTDIFNSRLFFVYYDDSDDGLDNPRWLIADMQAIVNNDN
jgi:hypothetical protein